MWQDVVRHIEGKERAGLRGKSSVAFEIWSVPLAMWLLTIAYVRDTTSREFKEAGHLVCLEMA